MSITADTCCSTLRKALGIPIPLMRSRLLNMNTSTLSDDPQHDALRRFAILGTLPENRQMANKSIDIVIPVLNEETQLDDNVSILLDFLDGSDLAGHYRIVIADNGSTDDTSAIGKSLQRLHPEKIEYLSVGERGVGLAFRTAIRGSNRDIVGYMDLDLATDLGHLVEMYERINDGAEIVVGSRLLPDSKVIGRGLVRETTSRCLNLIMRHYLGVGFTDAMCGFKFYSTETAKHLVTISSNSNGWFFCAEMLVRAEWSNIDIIELPITWTDDNESKVKIGSLSMSYLKEIRHLKQESKAMNRIGSTHA